MSDDSQLRCFMGSLKQAYPNITMYMIDEDLRDYSLATSLVVTMFVFVSNTMLVYGLYKTNRQLSLTTYQLWTL